MVALSHLLIVLALIAGNDIFEKIVHRGGVLVFFAAVGFGYQFCAVVGGQAKATICFAAVSLEFPLITNVERRD